MCSALDNDGLQGLMTLLNYLTTKANNYWKTIWKKVIYIQRTMLKSVRIFSLFLVNNAGLRSNFKNSCFVFHRGFQTLQNNKSPRPTASCFHQFFRVWKPRWNTRTRFWNITSNTRDRVSSGHPNTEKRVENTTWSGVFFTKFEEFRQPMKHCLECLIYLLKQNKN